jgi:flagellar basal body-associated protein FliL
VLAMQTTAAGTGDIWLGVVIVVVLVAGAAAFFLASKLRKPRSYESAGRHEAVREAEATRPGGGSKDTHLEQGSAAHRSQVFGPGTGL